MADTAGGETVQIFAAVDTANDWEASVGECLDAAAVVVAVGEREAVEVIELRAYSTRGYWADWVLAAIRFDSGHVAVVAVPGGEARQVFHACLRDVVPCGTLDPFRLPHHLKNQNTSKCNSGDSVLRGRVHDDGDGRDDAHVLRHVGGRDRLGPASDDANQHLCCEFWSHSILGVRSSRKEHQEETRGLYCTDCEEVAAVVVVVPGER